MDYRDGTEITIYLNQNDQLDRRSAVGAVLAKALELGITGGSAFRAAEGFGIHHRMERGGILSLEDPRGVAIKMVDSNEKIEQLLGWLETIHLNGLVSVSQVRFAPIGEARPS